MNLSRRSIIYIFFSILLLVVVINFVRTMGQQVVILILPGGQQVGLDIADSPEERMLGLFFLEHLPENQGMIFLFEEGEPMKLWTRGYRFPVDLVWLDQDFKVVDYQEDVPACKEDPCLTYSPEDEKARYAIAISAGQLREQGLSLGDRLNLTRMKS